MMNTCMMNTCMILLSLVFSSCGFLLLQQRKEDEILKSEQQAEGADLPSGKLVIPFGWEMLGHMNLAQR